MPNWPVSASERKLQTTARPLIRPATRDPSPAGGEGLRSPVRPALVEHRWPGRRRSRQLSVASPAMSAEATVSVRSEGLLDFNQFLQRNAITTGGTLPVVHTTASYNIQQIWHGDTLATAQCDVFTKEEILYFFVGRPSYKLANSSGTANTWQLPCCFIFEFESLPKAKRVFPFDSGAFAKGRTPDYISMMPLGNFDCATIPDPAARIIGAYFGDTKSYFSLSPKGESDFLAEFSVGVLDAEAHAVHKLFSADKDIKVDDRRATIEIQIPESINLVARKPLAVIAPAPYFDIADFRNHVIDVWKARAIPYPLSPLNTDGYYSDIYNRVKMLYEEMGLL